MIYEILFGFLLGLFFLSLLYKNDNGQTPRYDFFPGSEKFKDFVSINHYVDYTLLSVRKYIQKNGMDPLKLPDFQKLHYNLTNNRLYNLKTLRRCDDTNLVFENGQVRICGAYTIEDLKLIFHNGSEAIVVSLDKVDFTLDLTINFMYNDIKLNNFKIINIGTISVKNDKLLKISMAVFSKLVKNYIQETCSNKVIETIMCQFDRINSFAS